MKKILSFLLAAAMILSVATISVMPADGDIPFEDVPESAWYYDAVKTAYDYHIIYGKTLTSFDPEAQMKRSELVTVLSRLAGASIDGYESKGTVFADVAEDDWFASAVGWAAECGVVKGYEDNTFRADNSVTREEIAIMFVRFLDMMDVTMVAENPIERFADQDKISEWAAAEVEAVRLTGLFGGDDYGCFNPQKTASRAEIATVASRFVTRDDDVMEKALDAIEALKCEKHNGIHFVRNNQFFSLERFGQLLGSAVGLDASRYTVKIDARVVGDYNRDETGKSYRTGGPLIRPKVSIVDNETGKSTEERSIGLLWYMDFSLPDTTLVGTCTDDIGDPTMSKAWDNLEDMYVFNDEGKIRIPSSAASSKDALSTYFVDVLLGLSYSRFIGQHTKAHMLQVSDEDFAKVSAARDAGGECTISANIYNRMLEISSSTKQLDLVIMTSGQCEEFFNDLIDEFSQKMVTLRSLMDRCERAGIPTDYETLALSIIELYVDQYIPDILHYHNYERITYIEKTLDIIYENAESSLKAYLSGEKEPYNVPRYVTGDVKVDGYTLLANTVDSYGKEEVRPVYLYGYGDGYSMNTHQMAKYPDYGVNAYEYMMIELFDIVRPATPLDKDAEGLSADGKYVVDTSLLQKDLKVFRDAEKNNISVTLVIVHGDGRLTNAMKSIYPELLPGGGALNLNMASAKARELVEAYLRAVVPIVTQYKSITNIVLTNEPGMRPIEFGDTYAPQWAEFLKDKYGTIASLNSYYGTDYGAFTDVPFQTPEDCFEDNVQSYDYQIFSAILHSEWHEWMAKIVKELAPNIPISTKIQITESDRAMKRTGTRLEYWVPFQELGGIDCGDANVLAYDHIAGSHDSPVVDSEVHITGIENGEKTFTPEMDAFMDRVIWRNFLHHMGIGTIWSWDYWPDYGSTAANFTLRPLTLYNIGKTTMDLNRLSKEINAIETAEPDIALLYSYASRQYTGTRGTESINDVYDGFLYSGKMVRIVTEEQIEKIQSAKVLVIPESENVSEKTLEEIYKFGQNGGKIIVVGYNSLTKSDLNVPHTSDLPDKIKDMAEMVDIQPNATAYKAIFEKYLDENGLQNVWLVDAKTGKTVTGLTEWQSAEYDGSTVVTAISMGITDPIEVKLVVGGKTVTSSKELRSGDIYGETFTLYNNTPVLIRVNETAKNTVKVSDSETSSGDFKYTKLADGKASITGYTGKGGSVTVPASIGGISVESIGSFAFSGNTSITSVTVSSGITTVEAGAFSSCTALKTVKLPISVTKLGDAAFYCDGALESVSLGRIKSVGDRAFARCASIENIDLPSSVTGIGEYAFMDCEKLASISVPDGVSVIGNYAFTRCSSLKSFDFPTSLEYLGVAAFNRCSSLSGEINIPYGITDINYYTFANCPNIESLKIDNSVVMIDEGAFISCSNLSKVELPNSLIYIGRMAFNGDTKIERLVLPDSVKSLGDTCVTDIKEVVAPATCMTGKQYGGKWYIEENSLTMWLIETGGFKGDSYEIVKLEHNHVHTPGPAATKDKNQTCTECGAVLMRKHG